MKSRIKTSFEILFEIKGSDKEREVIATIVKKSLQGLVRMEEDGLIHNYFQSSEEEEDDNDIQTR